MVLSIISTDATTGILLKFRDHVFSLVRTPNVSNFTHCKIVFMSFKVLHDLASSSGFEPFVYFYISLSLYRCRHTCVTVHIWKSDNDLRSQSLPFMLGDQVSYSLLLFHSSPQASSCYFVSVSHLPVEVQQDYCGDLNLGQPCSACALPTELSPYFPSLLSTILQPH